MSNCPIDGKSDEYLEAFSETMAKLWTIIENNYLI